MVKKELLTDFNIRNCDNVDEFIDTYIRYFNEERPAYSLKYLTPKQYKTSILNKNIYICPLILVQCNSGNKKLMERIIVKIIDLEHEITQDIDTLVDLKKDIMALIKAVKNPEYQTLLELRYLCFKKWEQIALDMGYTRRHLERMHIKALKSIKINKFLKMSQNVLECPV